uniref:Chitin-binding type-4 domain-containing protein n=1 Tax=Alexandrium monilatum TaxID=311494 RepID=A0A7S4SZ54_9DINO
MRPALLFAAMVPLAAGHGAMQYPPSWIDPSGKWGLHAGTQCMAGCHGTAPGAVQHGTQGCGCQWYTNWTHIPGPPTIPRESPLRTYMDWDFGDGVLRDWTVKSPWRAPGTAPTFSPCGVDGGNLRGCPYGSTDLKGCAGGGYAHGPDARAYYPRFKSPKTTEWKAGAVVETAWGLTANHGGGYSFRLCKRPSNMTELTEECFQRTVLDFEGDTQWVQYGEDASNRTAFPAIRTTKGTYPKGSMWTRNPVPACRGPGGGSLVGSHLNCGTGPWGNATGSGVQFPPPFPYGYGFGNHDPLLPGGDAHGTFKWSIVDRLRVPADIETGEYILSWRWDCEQTPQVWNSCANIRISNGGGGIWV